MTTNNASHNGASKRRADRAAKAMREYPGYKEIMRDLPDRQGYIDCAVDLVTDLLHLSMMRWGADADYILRCARSHFETEQGGKVNYPKNGGDGHDAKDAAVDPDG